MLNRQRKVIYGERRQVLEGADLHEQIREMVDEVTAGYVTGATGEGYPEEWDLDKLWQAFRQLYPVSITVDDVIEDAGGDRAGLTGEFITEAVIADAQAAYERREQEFGSEVMREVERRVVLSVLDRKWREHLYEMDYLREGIGLRGYGQRDPLIEYQREGYDMFSAMMDGIKEESVGHLFNLEIQVQENPIVEEGGTAGGMPPGAPAGSGPGGAAPNGAVPGGAGPSGGAPGGAAPGGAAPGGAAPGGAAPGGAGQAGRRGVPAQGGRGGTRARGAAPAGAGDAQGAQGGTAAPRRDGRVSGAQAPKGGGRAGSGAHARRPGSAPEGQPAAPIPAGLAPPAARSGCSTPPRPSTAERTWRPARARV